MFTKETVHLIMPSVIVRIEEFLYEQSQAQAYKKGKNGKLQQVTRGFVK